MTAPVGPENTCSIEEGDAPPVDADEPVRIPRLLRAVSSEPPYDTTQPTPLRLLVTQAALPLSFQPDGTPPRPTTPHRPSLRLIVSPERYRPQSAPVPGTASRVDAELHALFGARKTSRSELPDPRERAAAAVRVLLEVLAGDRPARQVASWVSPAILERLERHRVHPSRRRQRTCYLRSLRIAEPSDAVAEVTAVISHDAAGSARRRAVALRMEGREGRWVVTALVVG